MSEKRRDKRNRLLRTGESQRADGRYMYRYVINNKAAYVYSWTLEPSDQNPAGKKRDLSLREKEKEIQKMMLEGAVYNTGDMTVLQLVAKYLQTKQNMRSNTQANYKFVENVLKAESFGQMEIAKVRISDAKQWLVKLQSDGRGYSTIHAIRGVVKPAFQLAVDDDLIQKNPFLFQLSSVVTNDSVTREAITNEQERKFMEFIAQDTHFSQYYDGIYILFHTGLRISEFCGLTLSDIDLKNKKMEVKNQLIRKRDMTYTIEETKTAAGKRIIPIRDDVCECFARIISNRKYPKVEPMVDGKVGFLFLDKNHMPYVALHWEKYFQRILMKYNNQNQNKLPKITPHVCRHTYCSNVARSGMNPKTLQYLMGHSDLSVTMNTYTHINLENVTEDVRNIGNA